MRTLSFAGALLMIISACAPQRVPVVFDLSPVSGPDIGSPDRAVTGELSYDAVPAADAAILGCAASPVSPACSVGAPTAEEDSAFRAEGVRLTYHADSRCRKLGEVIIANESSVMMYPRALVRWSRGDLLYGVGHAYQRDETWMVRIARRIDDLNERTIEEKIRTLRHEMSHTIGATESSAFGWSAEDYASRCG